MISLLFKNWKLVSALVGLISLAGAFFFYGHTKYHEGKEVAENACIAKIQAAKDLYIDIDRKQNEIIRLDTDDALIKRLRAGDF